MKPKQILIIFSFWITLLVSPAVATEQEAGPLDRIQAGVTTITLSNGLRVVMYRRDAAPVFAGQVWVRVGGVDEAIGSTGISHMLEHMAFKGTTHVGTRDYELEAPLLSALEDRVTELEDPADIATDEIVKDIRRKLEELWEPEAFTKLYELRGADGLNAGTSKDYTVYLVKLPKTAFEFWCWLESERLINPVFRQFYKEREVVLEERRTRTDDSAGGLMYEHLLATAFIAHPNRLPVIGWRSDLERLTARATMDFYKTFYRPDNIVLGIVGDIDPLKAKPVLEKYFGRMKPATEPLPEVQTIEPVQKGERHTVVEFESRPMMMMAYHKPVFPHPDDAAFTLLHELLSNGRSSLLQREFVQERKLASSVYTSEGPGERFPTLFYVGGQPVDGVSATKLRDELQQTLDLVADEGFSERDIQGAKRRLRVAFVSELASNYGLARLLGRSLLIWGDWRILLRFFDEVNAVTNEDLKSVLKKYVRPDNRTFVEVVDKRKRLQQSKREG